MKKRHTIDLNMIKMPTKNFLKELNSQLINKDRHRLEPNNVQPSEVLASSKYQMVNFRSYLCQRSLDKVVN